MEADLYLRELFIEMTLNKIENDSWKHFTSHDEKKNVTIIVAQLLVAFIPVELSQDHRCSVFGNVFICP
jgi:hypothetical protein